MTSRAGAKEPHNLYIMGVQAIMMSPEDLSREIIRLQSDKYALEEKLLRQLLFRRLWKGLKCLFHLHSWQPYFGNEEVCGSCHLQRRQT